MNGCMKMNDTYGSGGWEMTDTWNLFGDPSVVVRTAVPQNLSTHIKIPPSSSVRPSLLFSLIRKVQNYCPTFNNEILGTGYISGGSATIRFPALTNVGTLKVAVTAYNYIPYIGNVTIGSFFG